MKNAINRSKNIKKPTILVTGGEGMVGNYFQGIPGVVALGRDQLDITKPAQVAKVFAKYKPTVVIHLAAMTDVDFAQRNPDQAYTINAYGTSLLAEQAEQYGTHFIYVSTGAVFYGQAKRPYTVKDTPNPKSIYAQTKFQAELAVRTLCSSYAIVRTGWVFGGFERDKKFVAAIAKQIWGGKTELQAVSDAYGCPTYGKDLQELLLELATNKQTGIFHAINDGYASRYDIAKEIVKILGERVKVSKAYTSDFPGFIAPRPKFEVMAQNVPLRSWQSALREYLGEWVEDQNLASKPEVAISLTPSKLRLAI